MLVSSLFFASKLCVNIFCFILLIRLVKRRRRRKTNSREELLKRTELLIRQKSFWVEIEEQEGEGTTTAFRL